jgi:hypothetical protein
MHYSLVQTVSLINSRLSFKMASRTSFRNYMLVFIIYDGQSTDQKFCSNMVYTLAKLTGKIIFKKL